MIARWWLGLVACLWLGCAGRTYRAERAAPPPGAEMAYESESLDSFGTGGAPAPSVATRSMVLDVAESVKLDDSAAEPPQAEIRPNAAERMVHYDGWARMRVTKPETTLDAIAALAEESGGRVDRLTRSNVTVRVPVDQFDTIWAAVLALGDVMDKSIRADDITDQFLAVDLRVRTLRTMRDRLIRLLGRAKSEEEKLRLLQQITRVTEELDATESRLRTLKDLASMSTISVEAVPRQAFGGTTSRTVTFDGSEWIGALSPFNRSVWQSEKRIALDEPHEMVSLSNKGPFIAESADGTVLWTHRVLNDPQGSSEFWSNAIEERISGEFGDVSRATLGDWQCLQLTEAGADEPYRWDVCVADRGKWLEIAQAYYPSPEQSMRFSKRVGFCLGESGGDA